MSLSKITSKYGKNSNRIFLEMERCLRFTADVHGTDPFTILDIVDYGSHKGIREWYANLSREWWKPRTPKFESGDRETAENMIKYLPVIVTGARPKEIIIGTKTQSVNCVMKLYNAVVPPKTQVLDNIRGFEDLWERFLGKLGSVNYFSSLTKIEREMWLEYYQSDRDLHLEDVDNLEVEILSFGSSDFLNLDEEILEELGESNAVFDMKDVVDVFPRKPGSEGLKGRHTLVFRRGIWKVSTVYQEVSEFNGPTVNVCNGKVLGGVNNNKNIAVTFNSFAKKYESARGKDIVIEKQTVAIIFSPSNKFILNGENLSKTIGYSGREKIDYSNIKYTSNDDLSEELEIVKKATKGFTAAAYKSLLQKTIRFKATDVDMNGYLMYGDVFVKCVMALLLMNPGSFVPDIQRFVSGIESAFKRVIVTLFEDSFIPPEYENDVLSVIIGAFLAQRLPGWKPDEILTIKAMKLASVGYRSYTAFVFDTRRDRKGLKPYTLREDSKPFEVTSVVMDELRSFHGDLDMIRDISEYRYSDREETIRRCNHPSIMPLCHCVDQHWAPEIAYMYPMEIIQELKVNGSKPFSGLFIKLFSEVTGVNPRRPLRKGKTMTPQGYTQDFEEREFTILTRRAQELVLKARQTIPINREEKGGEYSLSYELDNGWISGMLGAVEVRGRPTALVTLHPDDPTVFIAVRKPSRDMKTPFLTDEREAEAIKEVKKRLIDGITLNQSKPPIPYLKGKKLIYEKEIFYISDGRNKKEWNSVRKGTIFIPYVNDVYQNVENGLKYGGDGIVTRPFWKLEKVLSRTQKSYIQKLLTYIGSQTPTFEFKRIGREGGGSQGIVSIEDVGAYKLLMKVKLFFPSAFERGKGSALKFSVGVDPLVGLIKNSMIKYLSTSEEDTDQESWIGIGEKVGRKMWDHQTQSLKELQKSHGLGRKGSFIWLRVGSGKSLLVLSYLKWLKDINSLTKYIIYTLPSSAIESVIQEIKNYGFDYRLMVPLKNMGKAYKTKSGKFKDGVSQGCEPLPYTINLIEHDHIRKCEEVLIDYMKDSIFVIDEVHKALNDTKRTAVALQLSHLSKEFIAMTGTPIIDTHTYKLIWWLSQIVPFEVNERNFWVAANGMISKRMDTGVKVEREDVYIPMTHEQERVYHSLVPEGLGGKNSHPRHQDWMDVMNLCYSIADQGIISEIQKCLDRGENGVFVVAENIPHQQRLKWEIQRRVTLNRKGKKTLRDDEIFLIGRGESIFLTDDSVKDGMYQDYKVVITTIRKVEGYTLTRFKTMVTSVYPSNNASREQVEGRINRIGQSSDTVYYKTFHTGILTHILENYNDARNLSDVLSTLSDKIH